MSSLVDAMTAQRGVTAFPSGRMIAVSDAALSDELTARELWSRLNAWKDA